jgi:hypothetical protein
VDAALQVVDEDRAADPELVPEAAGGGQLVLEALVREQMLARVGLTRVDEVPAELGVLRREPVEQRTLCRAVGSGEGAELEHDAAIPPQLVEPDAVAVEARQLARRGALAGVEHVREGAELALVDAALDVRVEALVVVRDLVGPHDGKVPARRSDGARRWHGGGQGHTMRKIA